MLALGAPGFLAAGALDVFSNGEVSDPLELNIGLCDNESSSDFSVATGGVVFVGEVGLGGLGLLALGVRRGAVSDFLELMAGLCEASGSGSSGTEAGSGLPNDPGGGGGLLRDLPEGGG